jgi:hypothetical protein
VGPARVEAAVAVLACGNRGVVRAQVAEGEQAVAAGQAPGDQALVGELAVGLDRERAAVVQVVSEGVVAAVA